MNALRQHPDRPLARRRALNMVEVAFATVIVSVILLTALNMVGATGAGLRSITDRATGNLLAQQLMAEILQQDYEDPDAAPGSFGTEGIEAVTRDRSYFDDVDDYDSWRSSPPKSKDGSVISGYPGWGRRVDVAWVDPIDTGQILLSDTGVKRAVITVTRNAVKVAELQAIRTQTGYIE